MPTIKPFRGLRPTVASVAQVVAPPYDVLNRAEARTRAKNKPYSFLHISKPEIDLPDAVDAYDAQVYARGAKNFSDLITQKILQQDEQPCYYIYRMRWNDHQQTGLVAVSAVADYVEQRIRKHEQTQPVKVADRVKQIQALQAQTGPVLLTYKNQFTPQTLFLSVTKSAPDFDVTADDGVQHQLWTIKDKNLIQQITDAFAKMDALYIADGHHRSEAAAEVARLQNAEADYFLSVIFPAQEMKILSYHRVVKDLAGLSTQQFLKALEQNFVVEKSDIAVQPQQPQEFGMFLREENSERGAWYHLRYKSANKNQTSATANLDVSILADNLLQPLLNISDPRRDPRIEFVGGIRGLSELEKRVNSGEMQVAFALYPTPINAVLSVADARAFMPPKSTWFEPKLADGLVSYLL